MTATHDVESASVAPKAPIRPPHLTGRLLTVAGTVGRHAAAAAARSLPGVGRGRPAESRWSRMVTDLGPTYVKGAQLLSTRKDLLPVQICTALGRLHDQVAPMTDAQLDLALELAYPSGRPTPFASFDRTPAASGSIACVYRATLHDGSTVAVKMRRPGIQAVMRADFAILSMGARWMQRIPAMRKVPAVRIVEQLGAALLRQLDLGQEAVSLDLLRTNLADMTFVRIPGPVPAACGEGALVMEFLEPLERFEPRDFKREPRRQIVRNVLQCVYRMLFIDGLVHCDMHPGNLYLDADGTLVLLDAGFVVQLDPDVRLLFAKFFMNLSLGRAEECAQNVLDSAEHIPPGCDLDGFRADIEKLVEESTGRTAGQFRLAPFATRLFDIQRRSGVAAAPEFVFPLMSLLVLEGMINDFDVDVDFQGEAIPTLLVALNRY
jgi:ubiquinone biosynthesis protein